jgi:hypothetical protein
VGLAPKYSRLLFQLVAERQMRPKMPFLSQKTGNK